MTPEFRGARVGFDRIPTLRVTYKVKEETKSDVLSKNEYRPVVFAYAAAYGESSKQFESMHVSSVFFLLEHVWFGLLLHVN